MTTKTYIIDNGRSYSDHKIYFVDADPAVFEPLWSAYTKAWPDNCLRCGKADGSQLCPLGDRDRRWHVDPEVIRLIGIVNDCDWRDKDARMTIEKWLGRIDHCLTETVADLDAAHEFERPGKALWPELLLWKDQFELRVYEQ